MEGKMPLSRRAFLKGLAATAAGLLIPAEIAAEPGRRVWAFPTNPAAPDIAPFYGAVVGEPFTFAQMEPLANADQLLPDPYLMECIVHQRRLVDRVYSGDVLRVWSGADSELVVVKSVKADRIEIVRGYGGTTPYAHPDASRIHIIGVAHEPS